MAVGPAGGAAETLAAIQQTTSNQNLQIEPESQVEQSVADTSAPATNSGGDSTFNTINTTA
ncbi:hypothetical protein EYS14_22815 [Alteromonadaceae bacterium M269]|nr:hypothetical protein EYS14_22815 [Alteromonadaceae bacterium M269]